MIKESVTTMVQQLPVIAGAVRQANAASRTSASIYCISIHSVACVVIEILEGQDHNHLVTCECEAYSL